MKTRPKPGRNGRRIINPDDFAHISIAWPVTRVADVVRSSTVNTYSSRDCHPMTELQPRKILCHKLFLHALLMTELHAVLVTVTYVTII